MDAKLLAASLRRKREKSVVTGEGKKVFFLRPPETEVGPMLKVLDDRTTFSVSVDQVRKYACGWEGYTEADILGATVGSSDAVEFNAELWAEYIVDNADLVNKVAGAILDSIVDHYKGKAEVQGN